jgi:hypothetical protein
VVATKRSLNSQRPELRVVTFANEEISADALPIVGYGDYSANDYRLDFCATGGIASLLPPPPAAASAAAAALGSSFSSLAVGVPQSPSASPSSAASSAHLESLFYILSPLDLVVARPRDYDDHVTWLLQRERYEEALKYAKCFEHELRVQNSYEIGERFLKHLFEVERNYSKAAEYCVKLLGASKSLWETYIFLFVKHDQLSSISPFIPTLNPTLDATIYELVLGSYLERGGNSSGGGGGDSGSGAGSGEAEEDSEHSKLLHLVKTWSHHIYHIRVVIEKARGKLAEMEAREKEEQASVAGRQREKHREGQERRKRAALEAKAEAEFLATPEGKKMLVQPGVKAGSLHPALYPPPPQLPPVSTLLLLATLAELYLLNKQPSLAFDTLLKLQKKEDLFRVLLGYEKQLLESKLVDERLIPTLMRISLPQTLELLLANADRIGPERVMEQLRQAEKSHQSSGGAAASAPGSTFRVLQHEYLHALFRKDHALASRFHDEQVSLYAEFAPKELMYFLKNSNGYTLERALEACEKWRLHSEMVFLLKRMGNTEEALRLIIDELHDVREAIAFVEETGGRSDGGADSDQSLWDNLITRSLNNPSFLSDLLEQVGSHYVDLSKLIVRIPAQLPIPSLKAKLITILNDCELQQSVIRGCTTILRNDCRNLVDRLNRRRRRAIKVRHTGKRASGRGSEGREGDRTNANCADNNTFLAFSSFSPCFPLFLSLFSLPSDSLRYSLLSLRRRYSLRPLRRGRSHWSDRLLLPSRSASRLLRLAAARGRAPRHGRAELPQVQRARTPAAAAAAEPAGKRERRRRKRREHRRRRRRQRASQL